MRFNTIMLVLVQLVMPLNFIGALIMRSYATQSEWLLAVLLVGAFVAFIFTAGRWDWFGYQLRFVVLAAFVVGAVVSAIHVVGKPLWPAAQAFPWTENMVRIVVACIFLFLFAKTLRGYRVPPAGLQCRFPLSGGVYYVAHGGSDSLINYHFAHAAQRYALDIVKLNRGGLRARGLYPKQLPRYAVFGSPVVSPVDGVVLKAVDGHADLAPPERDTVNRAGNHVVIQPQDSNCYLLLAHLQQGSVCIRQGENVRAGDLVGRVGNSGNTTEPHLHIHCATLDGEDYVGGGEGKPILPGSRFLKRNNLVRT